MNMVSHETPGVDKGPPLGADVLEPFEKAFPVEVVDENLAAFDPTKSNVMQNTRRIKSWSTWHSRSSTPTIDTWQVKLSI
jgi:hypothetical protein